MMTRRKGLTREEMLASVPRLNPAIQWERLDSGELMAVFARRVNLIGRLLAKVLSVPNVGQVVLDEMGSDVVDQIDGERSVGGLIDYVRGKYKLSRKEAEVALLKYLESLGRRGFIGFEPAGPSEEDGLDDGVSE